MNSRHRKTLERIFTDPPMGTMAWADIEALFMTIGCDVLEGRGSRVRFKKGEAVETFHRPHPAKEAKVYQVKRARVFLERIKVTP